jgi:hypothetical protein
MLGNNCQARRSLPVTGGLIHSVRHYLFHNILRPVANSPSIWVCRNANLIEPKTESSPCELPEVALGLPLKSLDT